MREELIDLWSVACDARCITTNGTIKANGRGVMGRGVAKQACARYFALEVALGFYLRQHGNHVGVLWEHTMPDLRAAAPPPPEPLVIFPVKHEWHQLADLDLIEQSARELVTLTDEKGWQKVVLPRPGCGNGGRSWQREVKRRIEPILDDRFWVVTL